MYQLFIFLAMFFAACSGPVNDVTEDTYSVTVNPDITGGVISISASSFKVGEMVRLEVIPNEGLKMKDGSLVYSLSGSSGSVPIRRNSFFMPAGHVKVSAEFVSKNDTQLSLRDLKENSITFQGHAILDAQVASTAENLTLSWESADESLVTVTPSNSTGTSVTLLQVKPGVSSVTATTSDGSAITVHVTMLNDNFRINSSGEIFSTTSSFIGGDVLIPSFIDGVAVKSISAGALIYCGITSVILPEGLESIGDEAFKGNEISSVALPQSLTSVGNNAFSECPLETVVCDSSAATRVILGENALGENLQNISVYDGNIAPFREAETWKPYTSQIRSPQSNDIKITQVENGTIVVKSGSYEVSSALPDEVISIEVIPNDGWQLLEDSIKVRDTEGYPLSLEYTEDGIPFFIMPDIGVVVSATFEKCILNYEISHVFTDNDVNINSTLNVSWGSVSVNIAEDLNTLTISPLPKFGYYLLTVSIEGVATEDIVSSSTEQNTTFVADISKNNFVDGDVLQITAYWAPKILDVTLYSPGWTEYTVKSIKYGQPLPSLASRTDIQPPAKIGYTFMGFYSAENGQGTRYYDDILNSTGNLLLPSYFDESGDISIFAYFIPKTYRLSFSMGKPEDSNAVILSGEENLGATFTVPATYNDSLPCVPVPAIEYSNYSFAGYWTVPQNGTEIATKIYDSSGIPVNSASTWNLPSDTVLQGYWLPDNIPMVFNYNGSFDSQEENISYLKTFAVVATPGFPAPALGLSKPYRTGFKFTGFFDSSTGGNQFYDANLATVSSSIIPNGINTMTLYAQWEPNDVTVIFRYASSLKDGTAIATSRAAIETVTTTTIDGEEVEQIIGTEYDTRVMDQLPSDITSLITVDPTRNCYKFTGFYDTDGRRYYDEDLQLDEASITSGLMPPTDMAEVYLIAGWELDGVTITSSNASSYRSSSMAAGTAYIFSENVSITGYNNDYGLSVLGTTSSPTDFYIKSGVSVTIYAGSRNVSRYSRYSGSSSSTLYSGVDYTTSSTYGPTPGVYMECYTSDGSAGTWTTRGSPYEGGAPGIYVPSGKCLRVFGEGKLYVRGADGIRAQDACNSPRMDAETSGVENKAHEEARAYGAAGGAGASGGGAGIGGYGAYGTTFTVTASTPSGRTGESAGYIRFYGHVSIYARGGYGGDSGSGSYGGAGRTIDNHDDHSGSGGGGGGGGGGSGACIGGGGGGGGCGGAGGNGVVDNESGDGGSGSDENGGNGSSGYSNCYATGSLVGNGNSGSSGGRGANGGGANSHSPINCFGSSGGSGGSGGGYQSITYESTVTLSVW